MPSALDQGLGCQNAIMTGGRQKNGGFLAACTSVLCVERQYCAGYKCFAKKIANRQALAERCTAPIGSV